MAVDVIEALQDTPEEYRGDSSFDELWQHGVDSVTLQRGGGRVQAELQRGSSTLRRRVVELTSEQDTVGYREVRRNCVHPGLRSW